MTDFGPPIRLPVSIFHRGGGEQKVKRGGGASSSSGSGSRPWQYLHVKGLRDPKKPGKHDGGRLLPKPPDASPVWDPLDPFIMHYRQAHYVAPRVKQSKPPRVLEAGLPNRRPRRKHKRVRRDFDYMHRRSMLPETQANA